MSDSKPKNTRSSKGRGSMTTASDDNSHTKEESTPGERVVGEQSRDLYDEERDEEMAPLGSYRLEGMMFEMGEAMKVMAESLKDLHTRVKNTEHKVDEKMHTPMNEEAPHTPQRKERRVSMMEEVMQSTKRIPWENVIRDTGEALKYDEELAEETSDMDDNLLHKTPDFKLAYELKQQPKEHLFRDLKESGALAANRVVQVTRLEKECHVRINDFALSTVAKAMRDIADFQEEEDTVVRMSKVLSRGLKEHLRVKYNVTGPNLQNMDMDDLFSLIAHETQIHSLIGFYKALKDALSKTRIMEWKYVSPVNHEKFYFQQLRLVSEFSRLLKILLVKNKAHCPHVSMKKHGLIRLFMNVNDPIYVEYCCAGLSKVTYKTMDEFFEEYTDIILNHYELSLATRELPYQHNVQQEEKQKEYFKRRKELGSSQQLSKREPSKEISTHNLSHIVKDGTDSGEEETVWKDAQPVYDLRDCGDDSGSEDSISISSNNDNTTVESLDPFDQVIQELYGIGDTGDRPPVDRKTFACLRKLMTGKCESAKCEYGHKAEVLDKGAREIRDKLNIHLQGSKPADRANPAYTVLQREKFK